LSKETVIALIEGHMWVLDRDIAGTWMEAEDIPLYRVWADDGTQLELVRERAGSVGFIPGSHDAEGLRSALLAALRQAGEEPPTDLPLADLLQRARGRFGQRAHLSLLGRCIDSLLRVLARVTRRPSTE
jgi:hypothetical protein